MTPTTIRIPPEAAAAVQRGDLIEAIKSVRNANGLDLKSAKEAVDAYAAGRLQAYSTDLARNHPASSAQFPPAASEALARGDIVEAIKLVREANRDLGLVEAKQAVDTLRAGIKHGVQTRAQPVSMPTVSHGDRGFGGGAIAIAAAIAALVWWFTH
ncbi:MAG: ribosomal protein L7/L12 [Luteimonas sp.]